MSYAIIRNSKYTQGQLNGIYRHNERKNTNYSNKNIEKSRSNKNYSIKNCKMPYNKAFNIIKKENDLRGWIKKTSNVACEYIITSDKEFFEEIGEEETDRYFKTAYEFVKSYKNLGEEYILSARVHKDEATPHLHLVFIPVVHIKDKEGKEIDKVSCTEFWKGKNSYKMLQDNFYNYMIKSGFNLERGKETNRKNVSVEQYKEITNYEVQEFEKKSINIEKEIETDDIQVLKNENKRVIKKFNILANQYTKIKNLIEITENEYKELQKENIELRQKI